MALTKHNHHIPDSGNEEEDAKANRHRCGGIHHCDECMAEVAQWRREHNPILSKHFEEHVEWDIDANRPAGVVRFRKHPIEFEAMQWKNDNLEEMRAFCGTRTGGGHPIAIFNWIGTYLPNHVHPEATAELWVEANKQWLPIVTGEWVIKDELGFYPCKDEIIMSNNVMLDEGMLALLREHEREKTFEEELSSILNKHSVENESGTPDFVLALFLKAQLDLFNQTVKQRAIWRGEHTELPALYDIQHGIEEVPVVMYTDGHKNEIGTAKVLVTPGEAAVHSPIRSVIPVFGDDRPDGVKSQSVPLVVLDEVVGSAHIEKRDGEEVIIAVLETKNELSEPKDEPLSESGTDAGSDKGSGAFLRYQQKGLTDNGR